MKENILTEKIIGAAIEVHKALGPGLLELTYLKLGGWTVGLLVNFNVPVLKNGIKRIVHNFKEPSARSAPLR